MIDTKKHLIQNKEEAKFSGMLEDEQLLIIGAICKEPDLVRCISEEGGQWSSLPKGESNRVYFNYAYCVLSRGSEQ